MSARRCVTTTIFASAALLISLQAQECVSRGKLPPFHLEWPTTVEYHIHEHHQNRREGDRDYVLVMADDSQGRVLFHYKFADGQSSAHVFDPVAAQQIWWGNDGAKAKIVKYPTPVADRPSCWRRAGYRTNCEPAGPPAGQGQFPDCRDVCYAGRLANALPPEKNGFLKCDAPGGTAEDLGMSVIQGIAAHGCRRTAPFFKAGNALTETWSDEYGLTLRKIEGYPNGDRFVTELTSLSRDEPDLSLFQPPKGYETVTLELDEVPCEPTVFEKPPSTH
jgi:hypothetical protein